MNIFENFQPKKQKGTALMVEQSRPQQNHAIPSPPVTVVNSLKSLLLNLDKDPFTLAVSMNDSSTDADAKIKAEKAKMAHIPVKATQVIRLTEVGTKNLTLYKQISIEANFDISSMILNKYFSADPFASKQCFIYPYNRRLADNYDLADFVNRNLNKPRHWTVQESELPYFNHSMMGGITASASAAGANLMLGGGGGGASSSTQTAGPPEHENALLAVQSRLLKWQNALHALLRGLCMGDTEDSLDCFYVLGRSLLVPATAASSVATGNGSIVSLPYTSAVFYHIHRTPKNQQAKDLAGNISNVDREPACMLIGVHKSTLLRLQQLGAQCNLVEDLAHPWTSPSTAAPTSASAEISVTATRGNLLNSCFLYPLFCFDFLFFFLLPLYN